MMNLTPIGGHAHEVGRLRAEDWERHVHYTCKCGWKPDPLSTQRPHDQAKTHFRKCQGTAPPRLTAALRSGRSRFAAAVKLVQVRRERAGRNYRSWLQRLPAGLRGAFCDLDVSQFATRIQKRQTQTVHRCRRCGVEKRVPWQGWNRVPSEGTKRRLVLPKFAGESLGTRWSQTVRRPRGGMQKLTVRSVANALQRG